VDKGCGRLEKVRCGCLYCMVMSFLLGCKGTIGLEPEPVALREFLEKHGWLGNSLLIWRHLFGRIIIRELSELGLSRL
jgi:hypothetical protein